MFKNIRIFILTFILVLLLASAFLSQQKLHAWDETIWVGIYPLISERSPTIDRYINKQLARDLENVSQLIKRESQKYNINAENVIKFEIKHTVYDPPPPPQAESRFSIAIWSLKFRYWHWQQQHSDEPESDLDIFIHLSPVKHGQTIQLDNSFALKKVGAGVVNALAGTKYREYNQLVLAHELLHLFGASDKYNIENNQPIFPNGFSDHS